jgi:hypothetical protein
LATVGGRATAGENRGPSATDYGSIQEAVDANPAEMVFVPSGGYEIDQRIRITADGGGLFGPGRIVQTNPAEPILDLRDASNLRIRDLTLARPPDKADTFEEAVRVTGCRDVVLENLQVVDNRSKAGGIYILGGTGVDVIHCRIHNYMRIAVDDRTGGSENRHWGYAFRCIDGTGIIVKESTGTLLEGNRIVEGRLLPTPEIQKQHELGRFVKRSDRRGDLVSEETWNAGYVRNWHQGSAILVGQSCDCTRVLGNYIENAAQGIDIHSDHVTVSNNIVNNAFMGMKAMHGSRNVIVTGNQFSKNDLWAIGLMPGTASHAGSEATADSPARGPNVDGGSIIANNVITDFGYGSAHWIWGKPEDSYDGCFPIRLDAGQTPQDPPLRDVIIQGNLVYDTGRDRVVVDGVLQPQPPRYRYAVFINPRPNGPTDVHFANNLFHPGVDGVSNVELDP